MSRRKRNSNKNDFGHVFVIAGSLRYSGAGILTAWAALRSGSGLVTLCLPKSITSAVIKVKPLEIMTLPLPETKEASIGLKAFKLLKDLYKNNGVIAIGPGLSLNKETMAFARKVTKEAGVPMVIDADGLNALAEDQSPLHTPFSKILTPHPGEMARLVKKSVAEIQKNRKAYALGFAKKHKVVLVLKGDKTVVADHTGKVFINSTGNPGMATAGAGDVLTGIIASFLGQGLTPFEAAKYAVYVHGLAGDFGVKAKTQAGLIASDMIEYIPAAIKFCSGG